MNNIEKEYNKRFSNQEIPNGDFDTDGLWDAIATDLDEQPISSTPWWKTKALLGIALLFIASGMYFCYQFDAKHNIASNNVLKQENMIPTVTNENTESLNTPQKTTSSAIETSSLNPKTSPSLKTNTEKGNLSNSINSSFPVGPKKTNQAAANKVSEKKPTLFEGIKNSIGQLFKTPEAIQDISVPPSVEEVLQNENKTDTIESSATEKIKEISSEEEVAIGLTHNSLPLLSTLLVLDESEKDLPKTYYPNNEIDNTKPKTTDWQIGIYGGLNNFCFNYSYSDSLLLGEEKDLSDTALWGYNIGVKTSLIINDIWVISSGLEYQNLYSRFNYSQTTNTKVLKEDEVLKVFLDNTTGDTLNIITGDTLVDAVSTRTIVHHNRYQQITIPLQFGFQNNFKRFIYGLEAGASLNFVTNQSGRTLDLSGDLVDFEKDSAYTPFRSVHLGFRFSPLIGYQFSDKWAILFQPQYAWNPHIGFKNPRIQLGTHQVNLMLGVGYSF